MCVCLFLVRRLDPVAGRQIWNARMVQYLSVSVTLLWSVSLSACLFVCLTVYRPAEDTPRLASGCERMWADPQPTPGCRK